MSRHHNRARSAAKRAHEQTWLEAAIARWGEPAVVPPVAGEINERTGKVRMHDGVDIRGEGGRQFTRRAWVWFPSGVNHHLHIDDYGDYVELVVGRHWLPMLKPQTSSVTVIIRKNNGQAPTPGQLVGAIGLGWGSFNPRHCDLCGFLESKKQCVGLAVHCARGEHCTATDAGCSASFGGGDHGGCCSCSESLVERRTVAGGGP